MPKAILEFNLPEENEEYKTTMKAQEYYCQLWDIEQYLRSIDRHGVDADLSKEELVDKVRKMINVYE